MEYAALKTTQLVERRDGKVDQEVVIVTVR
jgi:hypothetical protein